MTVLGECMQTPQRLLQIAVAVARCFPANVIAFFKLRVPLRETHDQPSLPVGFRAQFQKRLAERDIERQLAGDMVGKREAALGFKGRRLLVVKHAVTLLVEHLESCRDAGIKAPKIFFEIFNVGFEIGLVVVGADQMKDLLPEREDVGTAVLVFLEGLDDQGGAAGLRNISGMDVHNPERRSRFNALPRHHAVARFEDVQRDRLSGKENNTEREKWDPRGTHCCRRARPEGRKRICICLGKAKKIRYSFVRNRMSYNQPAATPPASGPIQ